MPIRTPQNNSNEYIGYCPAYIYRDYFIFKYKLTHINIDCSDLMLCSFLSGIMHSAAYYLQRYLFNFYKRFFRITFHVFCSFWTFYIYVYQPRCSKV